MKILLLHGMGGSARDWDEVRARLPGAEAWDLPPAPDLASLVDSLAERLRSWEESYGVAGYSLGGRVAILLAEKLLAEGRAPARLALLGAGLGLVGEEEKQNRIQRDAEWANLARRDPEEFWRQWYRQELFAGFDRLAPSLREAWLKSRRALAIDSLCRQLEAWSPARHPYLSPALSRIRSAGISVLYLAGENDRKYRSLALKLATDGVESLVLPGAGHLLPLEAPEEVASALDRFFK